jgi:hypothetical protein
MVIFILFLAIFAKAFLFLFSFLALLPIRVVNLCVEAVRVSRISTPNLFQNVLFGAYRSIFLVQQFMLVNRMSGVVSSLTQRTTANFDVRFCVVLDFCAYICMYLVGNLGLD